MVGGRTKQADSGSHLLCEDVLCKAHIIEHPHPLLRTDSRSDAAGDASIPDRGDRENTAEDQHLDEPKTARHSGRRWICLAHDRVRQDAHKLQDGATGVQAADRGQSPVRGRPQGPRLPDHA
ncbi:hypothetical protein SDC9_105234 [bioreactor metagenome]|uniref:Uncharacterized protein n=1 Tax=bioreactor metagenome TaxID=1076179 RepID=A0A645B5I6_9ZZZZ